MKPVLQRTILVLIVVVQSCFNDIDRSILLSNQLMSERPDSSLVILSAVDHDKLTGEARKARHALLLSMALDKNYIDIINDSTANVAYNYYKRHGDKKDKMLSAYYLGVVHQNAGNYIDAAIEFDQALSLAKQLGDNHYCGLACRHLCTIHSYNYNNKLSLDYAQRTVDYFDACGETLSADYGRINLAGSLIREYRYEDALEIIEDVIDRNDYEPLLGLAYWLKIEALLYGKHDYDAAKETLNHAKISRKPSVALYQYSLEAFLSEASGDAKEADKYILLAEKLLRSPNDTLTLYDQCARIYRMRGDYQKAYESFTKAMDIQNRQVNRLLEQSVTHAMEEHFRQSLKDEEERSYMKTITLILCGIVAFIIVAVLVLVIRKQRLARMQDLADIEALNQDIQFLRSRSKQFRKVSDALLTDRVQFLQQLSDSYFECLETEDVKREKQKGYETKEEIIAKFRHKLVELRSDRHLFSSLEEAVNASMDNIIVTARTVCDDRLKEEDYKILTLLFSGLSVKSIAFLVRTTEPALRTRKSRYKQLFSTLDEPESSQLINALT